MKSNKKLIDFEKVVEMFKKDDLVFFLERQRKFDWKIFFITVCGLAMTISLTSFFFTVLVLSENIQEKIYSLIVGSLGLIFSSLLVYLLFDILDCFYYFIETWRVESYDLCKDEYEFYLKKEKENGR